MWNDTTRAVKRLIEGEDDLAVEFFDAKFAPGHIAVNLLLCSIDMLKIALRLGRGAPALKEVTIQTNQLSGLDAREGWL